MKNFRASLAATGSGGCLCMSTNVAPVIGQDSAPDSWVRITPKPGLASQFALLAAAANDVMPGATALSALLMSLVAVSLFCVA